ncbi:hypothetical protein N7488_001421 [Penicillium malachiteum]|nr:hypothetical protein N7488_001421 [Penicillium malachiteum]
MPMITSLVHRLHNGTIKLTRDLINHVPYYTIIDTVGGIATFSNIAFNAVDPRVLALQGQTITVEKYPKSKRKTPGISQMEATLTTLQIHEIKSIGMPTSDRLRV